MRPTVPRPATDLARTTFAVLAIGVLLVVSIWLLRPFIGPAIWATMVVVTSWPLLLWWQQRFGGRRWLAVLVMTSGLLLLFVVPLVGAIATIVGNADRLMAWARLATEYRLPEVPPPWLVALPLVGSTLQGLWDQANEFGLRDLLPRLTPYAGDLTRWFVAEVGGFGVLMFQFLMTLLLAAVMYATGEDAAALVRRLARRLGGERGVGAVELAGGAIRGVALGVGVTAIAQAVLGGIGVAVAGVPAAGLLTAVMFMLCIAQVGPLPVLVPAAIWLVWTGDIGWGLALAAWAAFVGTIDNVIRPLLVRLGADLPLLLIFCGVIGGLVAVGLVGIFVGPVVLAVAYKLLVAWVDDGDALPPDWRD